MYLKVPSFEVYRLAYRTWTFYVYAFHKLQVRINYSLLNTLMSVNYTAVDKLIPHILLKILFSPSPDGKRDTRKYHGFIPVLVPKGEVVSP